MVRRTEPVDLGDISAISMEVLTEGSVTPGALGTETTVIQTTELGKMKGWVSLENMLAGDEVSVRAYISFVTPTVFTLYDLAAFSGAQGRPALKFMDLPSSHEMRVTVTQDAGVLVAYPFLFFVER